jgi:O-antigen/teichoic acid export membrane protein
MILKGPVGLLALALTLYWTRAILAGLIALLVTRVALLGSYDLSGALEDSISAIDASGYFAWRRHFQLLKVVFFVGLMTMLIALVGMIPRYFVEYYCGQRELGVYGALSSLISIGLLPVGALGLAAFVPLARAFANGLSQEFMKILGLLVSLSFGIGITGVTVAYFAGHQVLSLLFRPEYGEYAYLFVWIMIAGAVLFTTASLGASLTAARIYRPQVALLAIVAATEAIGCWVLTPRFGLMGAVWSCLGAGIIQFAGTAMILYIRFPRPKAAVLATADISD